MKNESPAASRQHKTFGPASPHAALAAREDAELIRRFVGGDEAAFAEIMQRYKGVVFSIANRFLHNPCDAEEVTQETFIRAYRCLHKFRGESSLATWLNRVVSNLAKNKYWYFFRRRRHLSVSLDYGIGEDGDSKLADLFASGEPTPVQLSCRHEFAELVTACMERLDPHHREILLMRNRQNLAYDAIALRLGLNEGTVKSRIARARNRLKHLMAEACPEFHADSEPAEWLEPRAPTGAKLGWPSGR